MNIQLNNLPRVPVKNQLLKVATLSPKKKQINKTIHFPKIQKSRKMNSLKKKMKNKQNIFKNFKTERNSTLKKDNQSLKPLNIFNKNKYKRIYQKEKKMNSNLKILSQNFVKKNLNLKQFLNQLELIDKFKTKIKNIKVIGRGYSSEVFLASSKISMHKFILKAITFEFLKNSNHLEMIKVLNLTTRMKSVFSRISNLNLFLKYMECIKTTQEFILLWNL